MQTRSEIIAGLTLPAYPRSANYDIEWVLKHEMGPNPLWLMESLTDHLQLEPGMRVLDLDCGTALTSIFLAKEFGVQVWAPDLWIEPSENWVRIQEAGVASMVFPLKAEAHTLPFASEFFDAIVSVDAYQYFGTSELYLEQIIDYLAPGGQIGIVSPGLTRELDAVLEEIAGEWQPDYWCWHSPQWWTRLWERSGVVDVLHADLIPNAAEDWLRWIEACTTVGVLEPSDFAASGGDLLRLDQGRTVGFSRITARRRLQSESGVAQA